MQGGAVGYIGAEGGATPAPTKISWNAYWEGERSAILRRVKWITLTNIYAFPVNETYPHATKGSMTRYLMPYTTEKKAYLHPPLNQTAECVWKGGANVRYTPQGGSSFWRAIPDKIITRHIGI